MTAAQFRALALALPDAVESAHMGHADFRIGSKIFATLPVEVPAASAKGMVKLTPAQQAAHVQAEPDAFEPAQGAWGRSGCTYINLRHAKKTTVRAALLSAWLNVAPAKLRAAHEMED